MHTCQISKFEFPIHTFQILEFELPMHTLKKKFLRSVPKLILKMAAFALTSQISEVDNFDIETSFQDFVKETQHKLLATPNVQTDEEAAPINCDLSSFMTINFDNPIQVLQEAAETTLTDQLVMQSFHL